MEAPVEEAKKPSLDTPGAKHIWNPALTAANDGPGRKGDESISYELSPKHRRTLHTASQDPKPTPATNGTTQAHHPCAPPPFPALPLELFARFHMASLLHQQQQAMAAHRLSAGMGPLLNTLHLQRQHQMLMMAGGGLLPVGGGHKPVGGVAMDHLFLGPRSAVMQNGQTAGRKRQLGGGRGAKAIPAKKHSPDNPANGHQRHPLPATATNNALTSQSNHATNNPVVMGLVQGANGPQPTEHVAPRAVAGPQQASQQQPTAASVNFNSCAICSTTFRLTSELVQVCLRWTENYGKRVSH